MRKKLIYSASNVRMIYENLVNLQNQKNPRDYEIRIDDLSVVPRTNDTKKFYWYQKSLTPQSSEVSFILYNGKSRRYDVYQLFRHPNSSNSGMFSQDEFQKKLSEALQAQKLQMEFERLKAKTKSQKNIIAELRRKVEELQSKSPQDYSSIVQVIQSVLTQNQSRDNQSVINGIPNTELTNMIDHYRKLFGEEVFNESIGIGLKVAEHSHLIEEVKQFVESKIKEHESHKE